MDENLYILSGDISKKFETFLELYSDEKILIEKIISFGQTTPGEQWLEQDRNEWVLLVQGNAVLKFDDGTSKNLSPGDYLFIEKNRRHRVDMTSENPYCIWLAVHF